MVSTFSLSPLAKENESLNHFPLMVLKKVLFPIPCGPGESQYVVKLVTGGETRATAATNHSFVYPWTAACPLLPNNQ